MEALFHIQRSSSQLHYRALEQQLVYGVEQYFLNFVSHQFNLAQSIFYLTLHCLIEFYYDRLSTTDLEVVDLADYFYSQSCSNYTFILFTHTPIMTKDFMHCSNKYISHVWFELVTFVLIQIDKPKFDGEPSFPVANSFNNSIVFQHVGVVASVFSENKSMLHNLVNEIKKYQKFYKIKFTRSSSHVNEEWMRKVRQELNAKFESNYAANRRWSRQQFDWSAYARQFYALLD